HGVSLPWQPAPRIGPARAVGSLHLPEGLVMKSPRHLGSVWVSVLLATLFAGCGSSGGGSAPPVRLQGFSASSSTPIALSFDDKLLLVTNPDCHTVSLFDATTDSLRKLGEI